MAHDQPTIAVETRDGHRFDLIDCGSDQCRKTVLFLPGLGISARNCIGFGRALAALDVRVLIHEWRGSGSSNLRASRKVNWGYRELLEQDLGGSLAAANSIAQPSNSGVIIGGHSLGSQLACMTAALHPDQIKGLIIVAGGVPYWRVYSGSMRLKILLAAASFSSIAMIAGYFPGKRIGFAGRESRTVMTDWSKTVVSGRYRLPGLTMGDQRVELESAMDSLQTSILTMRMQQDHWVTQSCLEHLLKKIPRSQVEQHVLNADQSGSTVDHFSWMKAPATSARIVAEWMGRQTTGD